MQKPVQELLYTVCSEMENGNIVALCLSMHGSACIVKHIYNQ